MRGGRSRLPASAAAVLLAAVAAAVGSAGPASGEGPRRSPGATISNGRSPAARAPAPQERSAAGPGRRPNVVVLMSDDQTLDSMRFMPRTLAALGDRGTTFAHYYDNYSLCCPSRATLLTGRYAHNHGVWSNAPPSGGFDKLDSTRTLPVWLQRAGYYTGFIGKYLNGYDAHRTDLPPLVPPGYDDWQGTTITGTYYDYEFNEQGVLVPYGHSAAEYQSDVFTSKAVDFIERRAPAARPFFLWVSYFAPHSGGPDPNPHPPYDCAGSAKPAPRDAGAFDTEPLPRPPDFNEADVSDKPAAIRDLPPLDQGQIDDITRTYRCRIESLLALDRGVARVVAALRRSGELDNTLILYTSDNGFFAGEHRIASGKVRLYEESIHLPLLIRGPGFPAGARAADLAVNADLAPTVLAAARGRATLRMDGRALQPLAAQPGRERGRELLIESTGFRAVHTRRFIYAEHLRGPSAGESELYDLARDPYELRSLDGVPAYAAAEAALGRRLARLRHCSGAGCRRLPDLGAALAAERGPGGCAEGLPTVRPRGPDLGQVRFAELLLGGRVVDADRSAPFRLEPPASALAEGSVARLRMRLTLLDGRRLTRDLRPRVCA